MWEFLKKNKNNDKKNDQTVIFQLAGLHCTSCTLLIDNTLEDLPGVKSSTANYAQQKVEVHFDPQQITASKLQKAIETLGYGAQLMA